MSTHSTDDPTEAQRHGGLPQVPRKERTAPSQAPKQGGHQHLPQALHWHRRKGGTRAAHTPHTHTGAHGTLSHRHDSGTERPPSQAPGHSPCPEATGPAGPACHLECHGPRVSPGPAGYCLHFPCRRPAELSSDAQPLKVTVFPGASATLQSFLQSGSQCWLAFRRTFTAFFVYFFGLGIYLMISDSLS